MAVPILSAMIGTIALFIALIGRIGYIKDNNLNYHHLPWQLYTFVVKSLISLKIPEFTIGF